MEQIYLLWTSIHLIFLGAEATFTPDMVVKNEYGGRYIDLIDIMDQIPD